MNRITINYKNTRPNPILGRDIKDPGVYKNEDSHYRGSIYVNRSHDRFYLDPNSGITAYYSEAWDNDYFTKVEAKSVTIEL